MINNNNQLENDFLPLNEEYSEVMQCPQEYVEQNPRRFIIEECLPACLELWRKNIYTYMVSDQLNKGECWIEIFDSSLSDENREIYTNLSGNDVIKFSYHKGTLAFGVKQVGLSGQQKLLELAKQFKMQDVQETLAYYSEKDFLVKYCGCYEECPNPNYKYMKPYWELEEATYEDILRYDDWEASDEAKQTIIRYTPDKATKSTEEYARENGMIYEDGRVYLSIFHYMKHCNYLKHMADKNTPSGLHT